MKLFLHFFVFFELTYGFNRFPKRRSQIRRNRSYGQIIVMLMMPEMDLQKRDELLYAIIDGNASHEEREVFFELCQNCKKTLKRYEQEKEVISFIRENLRHAPLPANFEDKIRQNISSLFA